MVLLERIDQGWLQQHVIHQDHYHVGRSLLAFLNYTTFAGLGLAVVSLLLKPGWRATLALILGAVALWLCFGTAFEV
jgi:hypothetical protein